MTTGDDPYLLLGVGHDADLAEIKRAYRRAALACHPDRHPDDPTAAERFRWVTEAYAVLSDPERRRALDGRGRRTPQPPTEAERRAAVRDLYRSDAFRQLLHQVARDLARHGLRAGPTVLGRLLGPGSLILLATLFAARWGQGRKPAVVGMDGHTDRYRLPLDRNQRRRGTQVTLSLPTPKGERQVTLRVPANTPPGRRFRIPAARGRGEVVVEVVRG